MICSLHCGGGGCASGRATRPRASGAHRRAERSGLLPPTSSILPRPANPPSPPPFPFLSGLGAPPSPPFGGLPTDGRGRKRRTEANEKRELFPFLSLCAPFFFFRSSLLLFGFGRPSGGLADAGRGIGTHREIKATQRGPKSLLSESSQTPKNHLPFLLQRIYSIGPLADSGRSQNLILSPEMESTPSN